MRAEKKDRGGLPRCEHLGREPRKRGGADTWWLDRARGREMQRRGKERKKNGKEREGGRGFRQEGGTVGRPLKRVLDVRERAHER